MKKKLMGVSLATTLLLAGLSSNTFAAETKDLKENVTFSQQHITTKVENKTNFADKIEFKKLTKGKVVKASTDVEILYEQEPNDNPDDATIMSLNKVMIGEFYSESEDGDLDWYKITITKPGQHLVLAGGIDGYLGWDDLFFGLSNYNGDWYQPIDGTIEDGVLMSLYSVKPGTYYVRAADFNYSIGYNPYLILPILVDITPPSAPKVNQIDNNDKVITGKAEAGTIVTFKNGSRKIAHVGADKAGNFKLPLKTAFKTGTKISVTATDSGKNVSKTTNVTVVKAK